MVDTRQFAQESDKTLLGIEGALQANSVLQNRYRVEGVLGVGGMGSVYQARDLQFPGAKRYVAVKEMLHHSNDPQLKEAALKNFQREANILAGLSHPSIPTIHDYFSTGDRAYLVMEYIEGGDLDSILMRYEQFIPIQQVVQWMTELCDVLHYLHTSQPPIIFRDVKPSNVMIDIHNHLRLIDFGIAKHFQPEVKGTMIGTEGYAPPESYKGMATPISDVFSVGATLHHVLTRHDPRLEAPFSFAERPIRQINPDVSPQLEAVVMKALAYAASERYQSALEMKEALAASVGGIGGSSLAQQPAGEAASAPASGGETEAWGEDSLVKPRWSFQVEEEIRSTPVTHKNTVFVTAYDNNLYAVDTETGQLKWKYPADDALAASPAISTEEGLVLFGSRDCSLYAVDLRRSEASTDGRGKIKWTFQAGGPIYSSPVVRHGHVFFGSEDGNLYAVRLITGRKAWAYDAHAPVRTSPAVTDEFIYIGTKEGELFCVDLGGQVKWRFKARREIMSSPLVHDGLVFCGSMDGYLYAVDMKTGWAAWKIQTNRPVISSPCIGDDRLFFGSASGVMYSVDYSNGKERWRFDTESQITSSPAFFNGAIYFGCNDKKVYCLDARTGKKRWEYETSGTIPGSPYIANGVVYIGSTDQHLYAFKA